jgi:hypothetical protein
VELPIEMTANLRCLLCGQYFEFNQDRELLEHMMKVDDVTDDRILKALIALQMRVVQLEEARR